MLTSKFVKGVYQEIIVESVDELPLVAAELLKNAGSRKKFALTGDLGAGKTALIQAFCRHLGVRQNVTSPTFSIANEYSYIDEGGREQVVYHLDLFRLKMEQEAIEAGVEEMVEDENYCFIEWPDLIESLLPEDVFRINITILPSAARKILFL
jgi:tRNA threonylcarbamoyladenosine biosynthesis protein TsaE